MTDSTVSSCPCSYGIAMVTEFFYPRCGGVEIHVMSICRELIKRGHHVIVITRYEGTCLGTRVFDNGLRAYYLPLENMTMGTIYPYFYCWMPAFRHILLREHIRIVHYHQCTSVMFHTSIREAEVLGIHTVYTDHSLMDSNSMAGVAINEVLRCYSCCMNAFICVSRADRDNFCQRQRFASPPANLHVIPNAVDSDRFRRDYRLHPLVTRVRKAFCSASSITVVVLSRLVYRKGVCLLETVMNRTLASFPMVNFLVGGTGDEQERIQRLADRWNRQCGARRVLVMGEIAHEEVAPFLSCGDIYLSCSLTESFNITVLEAFVSGCVIVSTNVGGVPELLPASKGFFVSPTEEGLFRGIRAAIGDVQNNPVSHPRALSPEDEEILRVYDWGEVTSRLLRVYKEVMKQPAVGWREELRAFWKLGLVDSPHGTDA